ncbi:alpha-2,8-sialyltransferase 8F isoform X1 [Strigops habroptila]|uniref:alpha-2,8-sialyltransferase 8F isoform X1 n=2 Tax=Strigops habroptila TaxID=2489341 RepID=UPI0011CF57D8|nr:alpha-2,8-sialyltransferase 8F isoform X1 [Strigops habroptila]XP_030339168.1 alpha-2,8-sialyltransferase 8F isoform X1 [Strigops habroptila]XP_030339178.1 alpha-2,8-sialyltransferase 8F isoform X1 [Strigops habroptila]
MRAVIALAASLGSLLLGGCLLRLGGQQPLRARGWEEDAGIATVTPKVVRALRPPLTPLPRTENRTTVNKNGIYQFEQASKCKAIQDNILSSSVKKKRYTEDYYLHIVTKLQNCTWIRRPEESMKFRSELASCCDAVHNFIASQNNSPLGSNMSYEVDSKKTILITEDIFKMLPVSSHLSVYPFKTCAVVGNGGILKNSSCGAEIDRSDFVFRCNLPPTVGSISKDVGNKTNLVTVNPSIIAQKYNKLNEKKAEFLENIAVYGDALLLLPAFSFRSNTATSFKVYHTLQEFKATQRAIFFHPTYLKSLAQFWRTKGVKAYRLSSGFMITSAALELCENVKLYGFWPFSKSMEKMPISHHYYDNQLPKPGFHAMPKEYNQILQLHGKGILKLQFGKCESD